MSKSANNVKTEGDEGEVSIVRVVTKCGKSGKGVVNNRVSEGMGKKFEDSVECSICLNLLAEMGERRALKCAHVFCIPCITRWLNINPTCPLCQIDKAAATVIDYVDLS